MKKTITINLDIKLIQQGKRKNLNMSATINNLLKEYFGPKKINTKEEDELQLIIRIAEKLKLPKDEVKKIYETLDLATAPLWISFKEQFKPEYDLWRFIEIRKEIRKLLIKFKGDKK